MTAETEEPRRRGPALASFLVVLTFIVVLVIAADLFFFSSCPSLSDLTNAKTELLAQTKFSAQAEADEHKRIRDEIATLQPSGQELIKVADSLMKITDLMANNNTATQDALNRQSQKLDQAIAAMSGISAGSSTDRASASAVLNDVSRKISELEAKLDSPPPLPTTPNTVSGIMTPPIPPQPPESKPADTTVVQVKPTPDSRTLRPVSIGDESSKAGEFTVYELAPRQLSREFSSREIKSGKITISDKPGIRAQISLKHWRKLDVEVAPGENFYVPEDATNVAFYSETEPFTIKVRK